MAVTGHEIALPLNAMEPQARVLGTLLSVARAMPGEWTAQNGTQRGYGMGVTFVPWGCDNLQTIELECEAAEDEPTINSLPEAAAFSAYRIVDALTCTTLSVADADLEERLLTRMWVMLSDAVTRQLVQATLTTNDSLRSTAAVVVNSSIPFQAALIALEDHLASTLHGGLGMIHLTPGLLTAARALGYVEQVGDRYLTATGHTVVGDSGQTGTVGPSAGGAPVLSGRERWIYASSPVWYSLRDPRILGTLAAAQGGHNDWDAIADAYVVTAFDPCSAGAVLVDDPASGL